MTKYGEQRAKQDAGQVTLTLDIEGLRFHDLRHEATSWLFEAGLSIEQVALVTEHKDWKMRHRYTHLKPESLLINRQATGKLHTHDTIKLRLKISLTELWDS